MSNWRTFVVSFADCRQSADVNDRRRHNLQLHFSTWHRPHKTDV